MSEANYHYENWSDEDIELWMNQRRANGHFSFTRLYSIFWIDFFFMLGLAYIAAVMLGVFGAFDSAGEAWTPNHIFMTVMFGAIPLIGTILLGTYSIGDRVGQIKQYMLFKRLLKERHGTGEAYA